MSIFIRWDKVFSDQPKSLNRLIGVEKYPLCIEYVMEREPESNKIQI